MTLQNMGILCSTTAQNSTTIEILVDISQRKFVCTYKPLTKFPGKVPPLWLYKTIHTLISML